MCKVNELNTKLKRFLKENNRTKNQKLKKKPNKLLKNRNGLNAK